MCNRSACTCVRMVNPHVINSAGCEGLLGPALLCAMTDTEWFCPQSTDVMKQKLSSVDVQFWPFVVKATYFSAP